MFYLISLFSILFFILAWRRLDWAVAFLIAALPAYLIRFNIFDLPSTLLEVMIWAVFLVWLIKNFSQIKNNFLENFKKGSEKIKVRYPFDWEIVLMLLVALVAVGVAGFSPASLGIWKAYFFEPALFFIVVLNVMKNPPAPLVRGVELVLWPLAISALAVSLLAIYQKITGQLIGNALWAAESTRRAVSFFGYPNAVGLYLGPIVMVMAGWLTSVIARERQRPKQSLVNSRVREIATLPSVARNDMIAIIFIGLAIIASVLSIYFAKSKGALLGVAAGLIVFGLMAGKKIRLATVAVILIVAASILALGPARNLALDTVTFKTLSGQIRLAGWQDSWNMLKDGRLITGAGLASYQAAVAPYHAEGLFIKDPQDPDAQRKLVFNAAYREAHWQPLEIYLYPHNILLNFWSEIGLAGLLLFVWVILKYFWLGISNFPSFAKATEDKQFSTNKFINIGLIGAMIVIIAHGVVDVPYFKNDLAVLFWLLVAMMSSITINLNIWKTKN